MKKTITTPLFAASALLLAMSIASCSDEETSNAPGTTDDLSTEMAEVLDQYVNGTVVPTYRRLADAAISLDEECKTLYDNISSGQATQQDVKDVCDAWLAARKYWEYSEAFLLGPATINGIDPHLDSWPLDKQALDKMLDNTTIMEDMNDDYITSNSGSGGLCGFHALEYAVFADGHDKAVEEISANLAKYAYAVAGDLKLQCIVLEAAWAGTANVSQDKQDLLEEKEATPDSGVDNYGLNFINAGQAGSRYRTQLEAIVDAIKADKGCYGIANEVGDTKITDPVASQNVLDVESWYSFNSKTDFQDNIRGINNVIMGGILYDDDNTRDESKSIYTLLRSRNQALADELKAAIDECIGEDGTTGLGTIIYPFRNNLEPEKNQVAIESCQRLRDKLMEVATWMQENM